MTRIVLHIYDFFTSRKWLLVGIVILLMTLCVWSISRIRFTEDITAFLPEKSLLEDTMENIPFQPGNTLMIGFRQTDTLAAPNPDLISDAMEFFVENLQDKGDSHVKRIVEVNDPEQWTSMAQWLLDKLPYLLTEKDYAHFDSLLSVSYVKQKMEDNRLLLVSPAGVALREIISTDPIGLATPVWRKLQDASQQGGYEIYQDFLFSKDKREGLLSIESAYSVSDVKGNALLLSVLDSLSDMTERQFEGIHIHTFGAAAIAITNTQRIKKDTFLSVVIAVVLIILVLFFSVRSLRDILLMGFSLVFGGLFALGILGIFKGEVSWIAVGITSIVIGIALNYPLHLILHCKTGETIRNVLKEIVPPLTIGNITTIAAFLSLLLVKASAMRDMGLFAALLLLGVILFVLFVLPHFIKNASRTFADDNIETKRYNKPNRFIYRFLMFSGIAVTIFLWFTSQRVSFESDMQKLNYMTETQRQDMERYAGRDNIFDVLFPDTINQPCRLEMWRAFVKRHECLFDSVPQIGKEAGFRQDAFAPFSRLVAEEYNGEVPFNAKHVLQTMVSELTDQFNYVLFVCGFVVFVFLCIMLGRLELGIMAFLPLTIGWVWILGIMGLADIHFNIVNIILATLIFGQGDDYTIFITEGLMYEYAYGKKVVGHYRRSIILSAVIMFLGIGSLIFSRHPAMRSLAEVTFVGMGVVLFMAFVVPSLVFKWLTESRQRKRRTPVTIVSFAASLYSFIVFSFASLMGVLVGFFLFSIGKPTDSKKYWYHRFVCRAMRCFQNMIPRIKTTVQGVENLQILDEKPAVMVCNHQSQLDLMCVIALHPKLILLTKDWVYRSPIFGMVVRYADCYPITESLEFTLPKLKQLVGKGYSVMVFPEGTRSEDGAIGRFHSGAFYLAKQLNLDVLPVLIHGSGHVFAKKDFMLRKGEIHVRVFPPVSIETMPPLEAARTMRRFYRQEYGRMVESIETVKYFKDTVFLNFIYKGGAVARAVKNEYRRLCEEGKMEQIVQRRETYIKVEEKGYGLYSLFYALVHKEAKVEAVFEDKEKALLLSMCAITPSNLDCK